jgi:hypothetical protein
MAYTPPNTFSAGTVLTAADLEGNAEALRLYLHEGVVAGDFEASQWIETRHIQPPVYEPYTGTQHGVSGHVAGQQADGVGVRLTFATSYLSGLGRQGVEPTRWPRVPNTSFTLDMRRPFRALFHWWCEIEHGPDNVPAVSGENYAIADRLCYFAPYVGNPSLVDKTAAQEGQNHQGNAGVYWQTAYPVGAKMAYTGGAAYGQRDGCVAIDGTSVQRLNVGLCYYSQIDRVALVNWSIALEAYYI